MMKCEWILCPVCGSKTRNKIRKDTVLENYPLYCPKCRQERLIKVDNLKIACSRYLSIGARISVKKL
ncbi:TPA: cysteine-rich KTR domain-containing protein [Streptococcus suis]